VLWTVDGVRINNRLYGGTSPNDTLPASMIERVEVLKGGESLFYGTQAAAGVINVVTRGFTDDFNGQVNANVDSRGGTNVDGYVRGSLGEHRFVVWASRNDAEGYRPYSVMQPSATDRTRGYRLWSLGGKYQFDFTANLRLNAEYQHAEAKLDNLSPTRVNTSRNDRNEEIASVRLDYTGNDTIQLYLKGYWQVMASYTHTRARNEGATTQRDRTPEHFAKGSIGYAPENLPFGANVSINWLGDVYSSPSGFPRQNYGNYAIIDFGAHLYVDGAARRHRLGVNVENLTGQEYATRGYGSAAADTGGRFLHFNRGVPRTLRVSYGLRF
jgi:outer membrane cobalamin receptor